MPGPNRKNPCNSILILPGAESVTRDELTLVKTPEPTKTWHPIPHRVLVDHVHNALSVSEIDIIGEEHGLQANGRNYFGIMTVGRHLDEIAGYHYTVGLRNSHIKRFPAGLVVGMHVMVCSNLSFSGEIRLDRRHTSHIERDLEGLVLGAVGKLGDRWSDQDKRVEAYRDTNVTNVRAHDILIRALDAKIVTSTHLPRVLADWRKPRHEEFEPRTAWSLFNCFTETLKDSSLFKLAPRTQALHGLLDQFTGVSLN